MKTIAFEESKSIAATEQECNYQIEIENISEEDEEMTLLKAIPFKNIVSYNTVIWASKSSGTLAPGFEGKMDLPNS